MRSHTLASPRVSYRAGSIKWLILAVDAVKRRSREERQPRAAARACANAIGDATIGLAAVANNHSATDVLAALCRGSHAHQSRANDTLAHALMAKPDAYVT